MKKILSLLMLTMFTVGAWAATVDLAYTGTTTTNMTGENDAALVGLDATVWSVVGDKGGHNQFPGLNKAGDIRLYWLEDGGNTLTVSSLNGATINSITFEFTGADYSNVYVEVGGERVTATDGVYAIGASSFVVGNANTSNVQVRIKKITIDYTGGTAPAVATPVISGTTPFLGSTQVSIACDTEGASIYYTIDGADPTNESTAYSAPFELTESATVKAIAYDATGASSSIASKQFEAIEALGTIAEVNALNTGETFVFSGNAVVVYQKGSNLYIQDESAGTLVYGNVGVEYDQGDVLPIGWGGKKAVYNQCPEVASPTGFGSPSDNVELVAKELKTNAADLSVDFARYMVVKNATLEVVADSTFMTTADGTLKAFTKTFGITQVPEEGKTYNVYGVLGSYQGTPQLLPTKFEEYVEPVVEQTAAPVITTEETETAVIVTATGDGTVKLYADGVEVENPYSINRTEVEQVITMTATAQEDGKDISETVTLEVTVPALVPVIPEYSEFYLVGTFNGWNQTADGGRIPFTANDEASEYTANVNLAAGDQFKIITFDADGEQIWIGAESNGNFVILPGFYEDHINITLIFGDEGENFEIQEAGTYKITLKEAPSADGIAPKSLKAPLVMVVDKPTGIETINNSNVKSVRYYNLQGVESATPFQGVNIVVREMIDGSKIASKMVK